MNEQFSVKVTLVDGKIEHLVVGECTAEQANLVAESLIKVALHIRDAIIES